MQMHVCVPVHSHAGSGASDFSDHLSDDLSLHDDTDPSAMLQQLRAEMQPIVKAELRAEMEGLLRAELRQQLEGEVRAQLTAELEPQLRQELTQSLRDEIEVILREEKEDELAEYMATREEEEEEAHQRKMDATWAEMEKDARRKIYGDQVCSN